VIVYDEETVDAPFPVIVNQIRKPQGAIPNDHKEWKLVRLIRDGRIIDAIETLPKISNRAGAPEQTPLGQSARPR